MDQNDLVGDVELDGRIFDIFQEYMVSWNFYFFKKLF